MPALRRVVHEVRSVEIGVATRYEQHHLVVGREQVEGGAHVLDVSVALTERADEDEMLSAVTKKL